MSSYGAAGDVLLFMMILLTADGRQNVLGSEHHSSLSVHSDVIGTESRSSFFITFQDRSLKVGKFICLEV